MKRIKVIKQATIASISTISVIPRLFPQYCMVYLWRSCDLRSKASVMPQAYSTWHGGHAVTDPGLANPHHEFTSPSPPDWLHSNSPLAFYLVLLLIALTSLALALAVICRLSSTSRSAAHCARWVAACKLAANYWIGHKESTRSIVVQRSRWHRQLFTRSTPFFCD